MPARKLWSSCIDCGRCTRVAGAKHRASEPCDALVTRYTGVSACRATSGGPQSVAVRIAAVRLGRHVHRRVHVHLRMYLASTLYELFVHEGSFLSLGMGREYFKVSCSASQQIHIGFVRGAGQISRLLGV
jgi:hypothetical protein